MLKKVSYKDVFAFSWSYWRRRKMLGALSLFFLFIMTSIDVIFPIFTGKIVDAMITSSPGESEDVLKTFWIIIMLAVLFSVTRGLLYQFYNRWECFSMRDLLLDSLFKVQRFSTNWHANSFAGGTVRKITRARTSFEIYEDTLFLNVFPAILILTGMTTMLFFFLPEVALFVMIMVVLYCGFSIGISVLYLLPKYKASANADTSVGADLADVITGNQTVKAFGTEKSEDRIFFQTAEDWRVKTLHSYLSANTVNIIRDLCRDFILFGMLGITFLLWRDGKASPGDIAMVITSFFIINGYLRDIGLYVSNLLKAISEMEDAIYFWKTDIAVRDKPNATDIKVQDGRITFDNVRFAYNDQGEPIYDDFSLNIKSGEKVALVGHSGSGKSTFVKLVQRLYDIQGGEIRIDGQNIANVTQSSLRKTIALVPQEPILFHRSLRENIAYGKPDASDEDIIEAAKQAYAHDFIESLDAGYDTLVGERGIKLSGGERQRVAIARAILADAPILILDEATSSLDSVSEHYIQKALENLMKGRTAITIAHRLSTIKSVDRILVFDQGRIVEQGRHEELIARETSHYKTLYEIQALDLIGE
ncbi:MAG: ABC transporter ATP-binding protein [Pseudomonadota bacterium]